MTLPTAMAINDGMLDVLRAAGVRIRSVLPHGPAGWGLALTIESRGRRGSIIVTQADDPEDGLEWLHASIALDVMPDYEDLALLHRAVFGRRRYAYQVFAPASEHVNIHAHALHLWGRADGKPALPEFGRDGTI